MFPIVSSTENEILIIGIHIVSNSWHADSWYDDFYGTDQILTSFLCIVRWDIRKKKKYIWTVYICRYSFYMYNMQNSLPVWWKMKNFWHVLVFDKIPKNISREKIETLSFLTFVRFQSSSAMFTIAIFHLCKLKRNFSFTISVQPFRKSGLLCGHSNVHTYFRPFICRFRKSICCFWHDQGSKHSIFKPIMDQMALHLAGVSLVICSFLVNCFFFSSWKCLCITHSEFNHFVACWSSNM